MGKFYLIDAAMSGGYTWLGVVIVVGSMISLGYYLPVIAAMWMREAPTETPAALATPTLGGLPAIAGGSQELDVAGAAHASAPSAHQPEVALVAVLAGAATLFFGIVPQPLFDLVHHAGSALGGLF
jgi:NADH-quinone oxidoreductase subunit N